MPTSYDDILRDIGVAPVAPTGMALPRRRSGTRYDDILRDIGVGDTPSGQPAFAPQGADIGFLEGAGRAIQRGFQSARAGMNVIGDITNEDIGDIADAQGRLESPELRQSESAARFARETEGAGLWDTLKAAVRNPAGATEMLIESAPSIVAGLVGGGAGAIAGSAATPAGTVGGAMVGARIGAGASSFFTEYGAQMLDTIYEAGREKLGDVPDDPEGRKAWLRQATADADIMSEARSKGRSKAAVIALFDTMFPIANPAKAVGKSAVRRVTSAAVQEMAAGGAGEALGSRAIGERAQWRDILAEAFMEVPGGAVEIGTTVRAERAKNQAVADRATGEALGGRMQDVVARMRDAQTTNEARTVWDEFAGSLDANERAMADAEWRRDYNAPLTFENVFGELVKMGERLATDAASIAQPAPARVDTPPDLSAAEDFTRTAIRSESPPRPTLPPAARVNDIPVLVAPTPVIPKPSGPTRSIPDQLGAIVPPAVKQPVTPTATSPEGAPANAEAQGIVQEAQADDVRVGNAPNAEPDARIGERIGEPPVVAAEEAAVAREPWEMTQAEARASWKITPSGKGLNLFVSENGKTRKWIHPKNRNIAEAVTVTHRAIVADALRDGKPVPAAVLADYPDLAPAARAPVQEPAAPPESVAPAAGTTDAPAKPLRGKAKQDAIQQAARAKADETARQARESGGRVYDVPQWRLEVPGVPGEQLVTSGYFLRAAGLVPDGANYWKSADESAQAELEAPAETASTGTPLTPYTPRPFRLNDAQIDKLRAEWEILKARLNTKSGERRKRISPEDARRETELKAISDELAAHRKTESSRAQGHHNRQLDKMGFAAGEPAILRKGSGRPYDISGVISIDEYGDVSVGGFRIEAKDLPYIEHYSESERTTDEQRTFQEYEEKRTSPEERWRREYESRLREELDIPDLEVPLVGSGYAVSIKKKYDGKVPDGWTLSYQGEYTYRYRTPEIDEHYRAMEKPAASGEQVAVQGTLGGVVGTPTEPAPAKTPKKRRGGTLGIVPEGMSDPNARPRRSIFAAVRAEVDKTKPRAPSNPTSARKPLQYTKRAIPDRPVFVSHERTIRQKFADYRAQFARYWLSSGQPTTTYDSVSAAIVHIAAGKQITEGAIGKQDVPLGLGKGVRGTWDANNQMGSHVANRWLKHGPTDQVGKRVTYVNDTGDEVDLPSFEDIANKWRGPYAAFREYLYYRTLAARYERAARDGKDVAFEYPHGVVKERIAEIEQDANNKRVGDEFFGWWNAFMQDAVERAPNMAGFLGVVTDGFTADYIALERNHPVHQILEQMDAQYGGKGTAFKLVVGNPEGLATFDPIESIVAKMGFVTALTQRQQLLNAILAARESSPALEASIKRGRANETLEKQIDGLVSDVTTLLGKDNLIIDEAEIRTAIAHMMPAEFAEAQGGRAIRMYRNTPGPDGNYTEEIYIPVQLAQAIERVGAIHTGAIFNAFFTIPTRVFRAGTTGLKLSFIPFNVMRDLAVLGIQTSTKLSGRELFGQWMRTFGSVLREPRAGAGKNSVDEFVNWWIRSGGQRGTYAGQTIGSVAKLERGRTSKLDARALDRVLSRTEEVIGLFESLTRVAEAKAIVTEMVRSGEIDLGISERARKGARVNGKTIVDGTGRKVADVKTVLDNLSVEQSRKVFIGAQRVTTDFRDAGIYGEIANKVIPFWTSAVGGVRQAARVYRRNPKAAVMLAGKYVLLPTIALWLQNCDEDWYKELPPEDKAMYWHWKVGDSIVRLPKPFEWGMLLGSAPESILNAWNEDDPEEATRTARFIIDAMLPVDVAGVVADPSMQTVGAVTSSASGVLMGTLIEELSNRDFFFDRPIVPQGEQGRPAGEQRGPYTGFVGRTAGDMAPASISPRRVDHVLSNVLGTAIGEYIDIAGWLGQQADPTTGTRESEPSDTPVVGRMVLRGGPAGAASETVDRVYGDLAELEELQNSTERDLTDEQVTYLKSLQRATRAMNALRAEIAGERSTDRRGELNLRMKDIARDAYAGRVPIGYEDAPATTEAGRLGERADDRLQQYRDLVRERLYARTRERMPNADEDRITATLRRTPEYRRARQINRIITRATEREDAARLQELIERLDTMIARETGGEGSRR